MQWVNRRDLAPPPEPELAAWAEELEITPLLAQLLWQRGVVTRSDMATFLNPSLQHLAPLDQWPGLTEAAKLLCDALLSGKHLCVWGDYDVDGITSTALVLDFLDRHGITASCHIPERINEGYGLNKDALNRIAADGAGILLTVDCGISDVEAVAHAKALGMTVIVSDHHLPGEELPAADALVNPRLADCPCPALAGVGVAFLLMAALNVAFVAAGKKRVDVRELLDLVALGTLADVVNLQGQNRVLTKNGLLIIAQAERPGLAALKASCNFAPGAALGAGQVVFTLAPRINAAGRLGSSYAALELLLTKDRNRAADLAAELARLNTRRREEEDRILEEALSQATSQAASGRMGLVLHSSGWHPGVIGIVASRVVEALHRPCVVLSVTGEYLKGSGRSIKGFDLHSAFAACSGHLLSYGGHAMAAGLSLVPENLDAFAEAFNLAVSQVLGTDPLEADCLIDGELDFASVDFYLLKELEMLQPFGMGNAEPVFASPPLKVRHMRSRPGLMLIELEDESSGRVLTAKGWRQFADMPLSLKGRRIRIAFTPRIDRYNGAAGIELRLKDWKEI